MFVNLITVAELVRNRVTRAKGRIWTGDFIAFSFLFFGESGLLENEPTVPAEQAHTTLRQ